MHDEDCHRDHAQMMGRLDEIDALLEFHVAQFHGVESDLEAATRIAEIVEKNCDNIDRLLDAVAGPVDPLTRSRVVEEGSAWKTDHLYQKLGNGAKIQTKLDWRQLVTILAAVGAVILKLYGVI